jgi:serine/threonine-protein kinase
VAILIIAGGVFAYQNLGSKKTVQLDRNVSGKVDDAVQSFKNLVDDNTR